MYSAKRRFRLFRNASTPPTSSFQVNGTSYLTVPKGSGFTLGTGSHTVEFWMYQTSRGAYDCPFVYDGTATTQATNHYYFNVGSSQFFLILGGGGGWAFTLNCGTAPSLNAWHHYAIVRNGTTFTVYVDGTSVGSVVSAATIAAQGGGMNVGAAVGGSFGVTGYITNFRVVNGTAVYTSNFNPVPTTSLTAIPNTRVLIQGLVDNGPNALTLTNVGGVVLSSQTPLTS